MIEDTLCAILSLLSIILFICIIKSRKRYNKSKSIYEGNCPDCNKKLKYDIGNSILYCEKCGANY